MSSGPAFGNVTRAGSMTGLHSGSVRRADCGRTRAACLSSIDRSRRGSSGISASMRQALAALILLLAVGSIGAACTSESDDASVGSAASSPKLATAASLRPACRLRARAFVSSTAQGAIPAAIRAAIRADPIIEVQGQRFRRNAHTMELIAVLRIGSPLLPAARPLHREAVRRCRGQTAATGAAWGVVFHETHSVLCCETWTIFVVRTREGWFSF